MTAARSAIDAELVSPDARIDAVVLISSAHRNAE